MSDAVMVPREPTEAMLRAGANAPYPCDAVDVWKAMLAAFPSVGGWEGSRFLLVDLNAAPFTREFFDALNGYATGGSGRCLDTLSVWNAWLAPPPVSTGSRPQEAVPSEQAEPAVVGDDGWIEWSGGENPVPGQRVDTRFRGDPLSEGNNDPSGMWTWEHAGDDGDIIAYRILPQTEEGS